MRRERILALTKGDVKSLKVKLHPDKFMYYVDYNNVRVSIFYPLEKQGKSEINKIKSAFNKWDTWEVVEYEKLGGNNNV